MDRKALDKALVSIIEKKLELGKLNYNDENYDVVEEELHDLEDEFLDKFGDELEEMLEEVHESVCPENDVLLPTAYLAKQYVKKGQNPDGSASYDINGKEGVWVDAEEYTGKDTRLVILPNPARLVLNIDGKEKKVLWQAK